VFSVRKGVVWLLLAVIAEVPSVVNPAFALVTRLAPLFLLIARDVTGVRYSKFEWYCRFFPVTSVTILDKSHFCPPF
jgi:hypothetical protein